MTAESKSVEIWIDGEFSGPCIHLDHFMVSFAMVVFDSKTNQELDHLFIQLKPPKGGVFDPNTALWWTEQAKTSQFMKDELKRISRTNIVDNTYDDRYILDGCLRIYNFCQAIKDKYCNGNGELITFWSDTCGPDYMFVNHALIKYGYPPLHCMFNKFKDCRDASSFGLGLIGATTIDYDEVILKDGYASERSMIRSALNISQYEVPSTRHTHHPLDDCREMKQETVIWLRNYNLMKNKNAS